jgi:hypothetical protein
MRYAYYMTYVMAAVFIVGETARRGIGYMAVNATTMFEDYCGGILLLLAARYWHKRHDMAPALMTAAWGYATGGMFVPFFAHLEAFLRGATFRADHPHGDVNAVIAKAVIWALCLSCLIVSVRSVRSKNSANQSPGR